MLYSAESNVNTFLVPAAGLPAFESIVSTLAALSEGPPTIDDPVAGGPDCSRLAAAGTTPFIMPEPNTRARPSKNMVKRPSTRPPPEDAELSMLHLATTATCAPAHINHSTTPTMIKAIR